MSQTNGNGNGKLVRRKRRFAVARMDEFKVDVLDLVYHLALLGATEQQMADAIGVGITTFERWKKKEPIFLQVLKAGKEQADGEVAQSLFHRAKGYSHPDTHIAVSKDRESGEVTVTTTPIIKHYPPDTTACIFWLKNRQKDKWKDTWKHEVTGPNGGPIPIQNQPLDLSSLSDEQLELAEKIGLIAVQEEETTRTSETRKTRQLVAVAGKG